MPFALSKDNVRIYYQFINKSKSGINPIIVFSHGLTVNWTCFKDEIVFFKKKGFPIIYFDQRGHGKSDKPKAIEKYRLELLSSDIKLILDKENVKSCILVGHSMGGMTSIIFSLNNPAKVQKLILINTSHKKPLFLLRQKIFYNHGKILNFFFNKATKYSKIKIRFSNMPELDVSRMKHKPDAIILMKLMLHLPLRSFFAGLKAIFDYDVGKYVKNIKSPTLIIGSDKDFFFPPKTQEVFAKNLLNSKLIINSGTHAVIIKEAGEIASQIYDFINE